MKFSDHTYLHKITSFWLGVNSHCLFFIGFWLIPYVGLFGQEPSLQFKYLTPDDGLSSSRVISTLQDYKGFMWFGTYSGLNRYDGTSIVTYKNIPGDTTSIPDNHIGAIYEDRQKKLFFGTWRGLVAYDRNLDRFIDFKYDKTSALYKFISLVNGIAEDSIGNLWLSTNNGLRYFDRINNKLITYNNIPDNPESLNHFYATFIYIDKVGRLWVTTRKGIDLFIPETKSFKHINYCKTTQNYLPDIFFQSIVEDKKGNIWFGSTDGLFCLEKSDTVKMELVQYTHNPLDPNSLSINNVRSLFVDRDGLLWIGTDNGGLNLFNHTTKKFTHYRTEDFIPNSLNNESIHAMTKDRNDNLWICTFGGGVNISVKNSGFITHYKNLPGASESLSHSVVSEFLEDRTGQIWVGTDGGGFNRFDLETGRFVRIKPDNVNFTSKAVLCMVEGPENQIWMGTWEGGLVNYNYASKKFKAYNTRNSKIPDNSIYAIAKDEMGDLWMGSFRNGLIHFQVKENTFSYYSKDNSEILHQQVHVVKIHNGQIYIGSPGGFQIFNPETKKFITYTKIIDDPSTISSSTIIDILIENDSSIWLASEMGLNHLNPLTGKMEHFFKADGLPDDAIRALTLDNKGILWVTTNLGICRFDYRNNKFKNFFKSDGLQSNEFYQKSIRTLKNGQILAGGTNGLNLINPEIYSEDKTKPEVIITDFKISNQKVEIGGKGSPLKQQISETKEITLTHKQSVLTFYFAALDFSNPQKIQYAYMMENFDADWHYSGNRRDATYTNLSPGKYIFRVIASNSDGIWNETGTALSITITPPWWKTKLAVLCYVLFVLLIFFSIYYYRLKRLIKQKKLLQRVVARRTEDLRSKNKLLITQAGVLNETNKLLKERQIEIANKNAMLVETAEQLNETNTLLEERQQLIEEQSEELIVQKEDLIKQRDSLNELNATKDKLFSILGHDLRSPFNVIIGFSELLYRNIRNYPIEKTEFQLGAIKDAALNTYNLLNNLLEWSRSQSGKIRFEPAQIMVSELLASELNILLQQAAKKEVEIKLTTPENESFIDGDPDLLSTVMRNLISNAIKFSHKNSTVEISLIQSQDTFSFSVKDQGVGMSPETVNKLFNVNTNASTRGTDDEKGAGLGLILCKDFIEKHNGAIWAESQQGKGSTFSFTIPLKQ